MTVGTNAQWFYLYTVCCCEAAVPDACLNLACLRKVLGVSWATCQCLCLELRDSGGGALWVSCVLKIVPGRS